MGSLEFWGSFTVLPACAGVILIDIHAASACCCASRVCGGDPKESEYLSVI